MKQFILAVALSCIVLPAVQAQNFLAKVPSSSSVVIKYSGDNFSKNVPIQKLDAYSFIKHSFFKMLHIDTLTSLKNIGINFEQDTYQYITTEDSSMSFVTLLHLNNVQQFLQLIKGTYKTGMAAKTEKKDGFDFLAVSPETYIGWNETMAIVVNTTYQNKKSYYEYLYSSDTISVKADTAVAAIEELKEEDNAYSIPPPPPPKVVKGKVTGAQKRPVAGAKKPATAKGKTPAKKAAPKKVYVNENYNYHIQDSINNVKRELWEQQQDMIAKKKQQWVAEKIMSSTINGSISSIENEVAYKKIIDPAAHASVWINTESISSQYWNYLYRGSYYFLHNMPKIIKDTTDGFKSSVNIYFDKDQMRMEQKTFAADTKIAKMGNEVMNSKQNPSLVNYVNPDNIGYFSMSINTEAMANYYYTLLKKYISGMPGTNDYAAIVDVYIDFLQILIDEKGIAELTPGNYLFVMHDMKTKTVSYTDYDYDKEFNKKEVKKTKQELSPDFTFIMETKKEGFMEKIARLPLKYAEKEKYNYKDKGGYYELAFEEGKYPISSLYFMVKDGKAIVTTSKTVVDMTLNNTAFATDAATKNSILSNNYSLKISATKLIEKLGPEFTTDMNKKIGDYMRENLGDLKMESGMKDGMIQGTTTMGIKGNHSNSLEFFFNMMDAINNIIEKDHQEKDKTVN
ncbi:DUF4836 family protein [Ferruginibacter sp. SUN106]|uniref:DUF4836 family protein n=1 Tax=Ferruginibacter sp. SUN106 TaxID=2978348 RepID=UPI003D369352